MPETNDKITQDSATLTQDVGQDAGAAAPRPAISSRLGFKLPSLKRPANLLGSSRLAYPLTIAAIVALLCWFMWFLYNNVYQTIIIGQQITNLKTVVITQELNIKDFDRILELTKNKKIGAAWRADKLNNAFVFGARIPIAPASAASAASSSATTTATSTKPASSGRQQ